MQSNAYHHDKHIQVSPGKRKRQINNLQEWDMPDFKIEDMVDVRAPYLVN